MTRGGERVVARILGDVRKRGDRALIEYSRRFDHVRQNRSDLSIPNHRLREAFEGLEPSEKRALRKAAFRIRRFHQEACKRVEWKRDPDGLRLGRIRQPMERVGVYVPGGKAVYPSTVLMNTIPAVVAGVPEVVLVTPPRPEGVSRYILAAAFLSGVTEAYRVGGAQAIAALAYGTETIRPVDKIVGPGNRYVAEAKRQVFGRVGIDMIAGPTEVVIVSDGSAPASFVAADLIAQAEHDELAWPLFIATSRRIVDAVLREVQSQLSRLEGERRKVAESSLNDYGLGIIVRRVEEAVEIVNAVAPEHLELFVKEPRAWVRRVRHAGAIFLGAWAPVPLGDYIAGPNHVLPTGGTARFSSPLGVGDFMKESSLIEGTKRGFAAVAREGIRLARMEGLEGHARSMEIRCSRKESGE